MEKKVENSFGRQVKIGDEIVFVRHNSLIKAKVTAISKSGKPLVFAEKSVFDFAKQRMVTKPGTDYPRGDFVLYN